MFEHGLGREIGVWGGNPELRIWSNEFNNVQTLNCFSVVTVTCLNVKIDTYVYWVQKCTAVAGVTWIAFKIYKNFQEQSSCRGEGYLCTCVLPHHTV